jgi:AraC-like DNA-binding protein
MLLLPLPLVVAFALGLLLARAVLRGEGHPLLRLLIATCALQSAIVALVQHYGLDWLRPLQPVTATLAPPLAWLAFVADVERPLGRARDAAHGLGPLAALAAVLAAPAALDVLVPGIYLGYGAALLHATRAAGAALARTRLDAGETPRLVWRAIAAALLASGASDVLIALDLAFGAGAWRGPVLSLVSAAILLALGALALSRALDPPPEHAPDEPASTPPAPPDAQREARLVAGFERLMSEGRVYLDPDLTLARLARKLGVPAKPLSAAINRAYGESVSRVVNARRIAHAAGLLEAGAPVTRAMLESGFATKSNFNREFRRIKGASPTAWLAARRADDPSRAA